VVVVVDVVVVVEVVEVVVVDVVVEVDVVDEVVVVDDGAVVEVVVDVVVGLVGAGAHASATAMTAATVTPNAARPRWFLAPMSLSPSPAEDPPRTLTNARTRPGI
jgi:hypothetical protein